MNYFNKLLTNIVYCTSILLLDKLIIAVKFYVPMKSKSYSLYYYGLSTAESNCLPYLFSMLSNNFRDLFGVSVIEKYFL